MLTRKITVKSSGDVAYVPTGSEDKKAEGGVTPPTAPLPRTGVNPTLSAHRKQFVEQGEAEERPYDVWTDLPRQHIRDLLIAQRNGSGLPSYHYRSGKEDISFQLLSQPDDEHVVLETRAVWGRVLTNELGAEPLEPVQSNARRDAKASYRVSIAKLFARALDSKASITLMHRAKVLLNAAKDCSEAEHVKALLPYLSGNTIDLATAFGERALPKSLSPQNVAQAVTALDRVIADDDNVGLPDFLRVERRPFNLRLPPMSASQVSEWMRELHRVRLFELSIAVKGRVPASISIPVKSRKIELRGFEAPLTLHFSGTTDPVLKVPANLVDCAKFRTASSPEDVVALRKYERLYPLEGVPRVLAEHQPRAISEHNPTSAFYDEAFDRECCTFKDDKQGPWYEAQDEDFRLMMLLRSASVRTLSGTGTLIAEDPMYSDRWYIQLDEGGEAVSVPLREILISQQTLERRERVERRLSEALNSPEAQIMNRLEKMGAAAKRGRQLLGTKASGLVHRENDGKSQVSPSQDTTVASTAPIPQEFQNLLHPDSGGEGPEPPAVHFHGALRRRTRGT